MKAKINLHNRPNGRIDTFQPYTSSVKNTVVVDRDNRLNAAYNANYGQACLLLQAIQMNGRRRLSNKCILQLASFVAKAWEKTPNENEVIALAKLMTNLLDTTLLCPEKPFDEALKQFCRNNIPTHSVSPSITLLIAIGYIERLKLRYTNIKGTPGCGHRLIMVAYMMAAKFMHVNLKSMIDTRETTTTTTSLPPHHLTPTSAERSTIQQQKTYTLPPIHTEQLPSPPTSPKAYYSDSDPLNYHYFQSPKKTTTPTTTTTTTNNTTPSPSTQPAAVRQERHYQILRMELEFLNFLNYDLSLSDTLNLVHWAQGFQDDDDDEEEEEFQYTSGDEGGDESEF
ncbi:hypothetical protein BD770DRAFT_411080 [Pilaira anomala]|nr:hypothetical protein BD770DRAFT_411080 [Pilaira anomala]